MHLRLFIFIALFFPAMLCAAGPTLIAAPGQTLTHNACFSPDGKYLLTRHEDTPITLWDVASAKVLCTLEPPNSAGVAAIAFTPDGKSAVTTCWDKNICVWEIPSGKLLRQFDKLPTAARSIAFAHDGKTVLTTHPDQFARLWNFEDGKILRTFNISASEATVQFSANGKQMKFGDSTRVLIFDTETGKLAAQYGEEKNHIYCTAFSPDGKSVALGDQKGKVSIVETASGENVGGLPTLKNNVRAVAFSPDGKTLVASCLDSPPILIDIATGGTLVEYNTKGVHTAIFSPDGKTILTLGFDRTVRLFDVATGREFRQFTGTSQMLRSAAWSPDGAKIATCSMLWQIRMWDLKEGREMFRINDAAGSIAFTPDSSAIFAVARGIASYNVGTGDKLSKFPLFAEGDAANSSGESRFGGISPDGKEMLITRGRSSYFLDAATGKEVRHVDEGNITLNVHFARLSSKGDLFVTATNSPPTLTIRRAATGEVYQQIPVSEFAETAAFSADTKRIVVSLVDDTTRVYDLFTGKETCKLASNQFAMHICFSPDGKTILLAYNLPEVYDAATGKLLFTLPGHRGSISHVAFSPNGKFILTAAYDSTARIWDAATGKHLATLYSFNDNSWAVITPDNRYDASDPHKNPNLHWVEDGNIRPLEKFAEKYHTPDLLQKLLK